MRIAGITVLAVLLFAQNSAKKPDRSDAQGQNQSNSTTSPAVVVNCDEGTAAIAEHNQHKAPEGDTPIQWSNWALVIVAAITGCVIWLQTKATRESVAKMRQSIGLMERQRDEMQKSREIQTRTLLLQYRPKLIVRNAWASDFNVAELGQPANGKVRFTVVNVGGSPAHITDGAFQLFSTEADGKRRDTKYGPEYQFGKFSLQPGQDVTVTEQMGVGVTNDIQWANFHEGLRTEPMRFIHLGGVLQYKDDLEIPRQTVFTRSYNAKTGNFEASKNPDDEYAD